MGTWHTKLIFFSNWTEKSALLQINSFDTPSEKMTCAQDDRKAGIYIVNRDGTGGLTACGAAMSEECALVIFGAEQGLCVTFVPLQRLEWEAAAGCLSLTGWWNGSVCFCTWGMVDFRRTLTLSFFFKFYLTVLQKLSKNHNGNVSAAREGRFVRAFLVGKACMGGIQIQAESYLITNSMLQ